MLIFLFSTYFYFIVSSLLTTIVFFLSIFVCVSMHVNWYSIHIQLYILWCWYLPLFINLYFLFYLHLSILKRFVYNVRFFCVHVCMDWICRSIWLEKELICSSEMCILLMTDSEFDDHPVVTLCGWQNVEILQHGPGVE